MAESKYSLVRKELLNILDLATCDDTLYSDGINLELEACAKKGIELINEKSEVYVIFEDYATSQAKGSGVLGVYEDLSKAEAELKDIIKEVKYEDYGFDKEEEGQDSYEAWLDGEYDNRHYSVRIITEWLQ